MQPAAPFFTQQLRKILQKSAHDYTTIYLGVGVSRSYFLKLRAGTARNPSYQLIYAFSQYFDVPVAYWFPAGQDD